MERARPAGNLSDDHQTRRLRGGVLAFGVALVIAVAMLKLGAPTPARLLLFVPFLAACFGLFQGLHGI
jgi:hypothetical protein